MSSDVEAAASSEDVSKEVSSVAHSPAAPSYPEGGRDAWLTVLAGFLISMAGVGYINSFSVFQAYYRRVELPSYSDDDIAWIASLQIWGAFFFGLPAGRLMDRYGPKVPIALATFFIVLGTMTASVSKQYYQFVLSQGLCSGLGFGLAFAPALATPSQWFLKRRGIATGLVVSGSSVGGVIWPIAINRLLNYDGVSLGWTLRTIGFLQLALMVAATVLIRSRLPRNMAKKSVPLHLFFTDPRVLLLTFGAVLLFLALYIPFFYITPFGIRNGASVGAAFYYPSIMNGLSFFGRFLLGLAADRVLGYLNAIVIFTFITSFILFGWIGVKNNAGSIVWSVFYGFFSGSLQSLLTPCIAPLAPSPALVGTWVGVSLAIMSFAALGSSPIAGHLLDKSDGRDYLPVQLFAGFLMLGAGVVFVTARFVVSKKARV